MRADLMSKYHPLEAFLAHRADQELPMTFAEVEALLGFRLPPSARAHPQWWSNNVGSHVAVRAWRDVGWRTSRVDVGGERLVFVREAASRRDASPAEAREDEITISWSELNASVRKLLERGMAAGRLDLKAAVIEALDGAVRDDRRRLLESFRARSTGPTEDSVPLIREDRDSR